MDWRVLFTTFGIIFLAEMGDKTQLVAMTMAAEKKRPWEVFLGASLALAAVSAVGIIVGTALGHHHAIVHAPQPAVENPLEPGHFLLARTSSR